MKKHSYAPRQVHKNAGVGAMGEGPSSDTRKSKPPESIYREDWAKPGVG